MQGSDDGESESSDDDQTASPASPEHKARKHKVVETVYIDDIYKGTFIGVRASTSEHRRWSDHDHLPYRVLFCLTTGHRLRKWAIGLNNNVYFQAFVQVPHQQDTHLAACLPFSPSLLMRAMSCRHVRPCELG